jgi:integrase
MSGSDYIEFEKAIFIGQKLLKSTKQSKRIKGLYIIVAVNLGFRIGDLLGVRWKDLTGDRIYIVEEKTGKKVDRKLNHYIKDAVALYSPGEPESFVFVSQKDTVFSPQAINRFLQDQWGISSHGLRKSFGRYVYEANGSCEDILVKLSEIFNHSNLKVTRTYLGIRQKEIDDIFDAM